MKYAALTEFSYICKLSGKLAAVVVSVTLFQSLMVLGMEENLSELLVAGLFTSIFLTPPGIK